MIVIDKEEGIYNNILSHIKKISIFFPFDNITSRYTIKIQ